MLHEVTPDDLIEFGMIPELIGRLPVISTLGPLDLDALVKILTEPKNALVRQYQRFFEMEGCTLEFTPGALKLIAEKAMERDTGARALRAVIEEIMLDVMFDLPEMKDTGRWVVTEAVVRGEETLFSPAAKARRRKESA